jgi:flagellar basal body-associated protein FliL
MTKKPLIILFVVIITLIIAVGVVQAFTMGNVDGQWSCIEPNDGGCGLATNKRWATGPESGSTAFDDPVHVLLIW